MGYEFFHIQGMHCTSCAQTIEEVVTKASSPAIENVRVFFPLNFLVVESNSAAVNVKQLNILLKSYGYSLKRINLDEIITAPQMVLFKTLFRLILVLSLTIILHIFGQFLQKYFLIFFILLSALSIKYIIYMKNEFISKRWGMGTFISIALILTATIFLINLNREQAGKYTPVGATLASYAMILFFVEFGKTIGEVIRLRFFKRLFQGLEVLNKVVLVKNHNTYIGKLVKDVKKGDIVVVKAGDTIYVDGKIVRGCANVSEAVVTGESEPVYKCEGMDVYSGSQNIDGVLEILVSNNFFTSTFGIIQFYLLRKLSERTDTQITVDKFLRYFISGELILIGVILGFSWYWGIVKAFERAATIALLACPCAFGIATPLVIGIGYLLTYKKNILLNNPNILETFKDVKFLILDKTGTLTNAVLTVNNYNFYTDNTTLIQILYTLAQFTNHPKAIAVSRFLQNKFQDIAYANITGFQTVPGKGFKGIHNDKTYYIGNFSLVVENFNFLDELKEEHLNKELYFFTDNKILATFDFMEEISEHTKEVIEDMKKIYEDVVIVSGDKYEKVKRCAESLSINTFYYEKTPTEKLDIIREFKKKGKTIFVGDGINDALSLEEADIGISLGGAQDLAKNSADAILLDNDLTNIPKLKKISQLTVFAIKTNIIWALVYNIIFIPLGLGIHHSIHISPVTASILMSASSILLTLNSSLILRFAK